MSHWNEYDMIANDNNCCGTYETIHGIIEYQKKYIFNKYSHTSYKITAGSFFFPCEEKRKGIQNQNYALKINEYYPELSFLSYMFVCCFFFLCKNADVSIDGSYFFYTTFKVYDPLSVIWLIY